jgi:hypothetical protein
MIAEEFLNRKDAKAPGKIFSHRFSQMNTDYDSSLRGSKPPKAVIFRSSVFICVICGWFSLAAHP